MIETGRLIVREWRDADLEPFAAMCADPRVMATLGPLMTREQAWTLIERNRGHQAAHGCCFWAIERREDGAFMGWCGVKPGAVDTPIEGEMEIGWRLAADEWGKGYAREAAEGTLAWVWARTDAPLISAITSVGNHRSWGLMERLGMVRAPEGDFDHPAVPVGDPLRPHVVYRIRRTV